MTILLRGGAALLLAACALPLRVAAQATAAAPAASAPVPLVDVPYVPQSEALCGGAAIAMVLRYWGERDVHAEQFASLVIDSGEGILTTDLVDAVRARGWRAQPFRGTGDDVRTQLARGWPVIALIEDRPDRYHYVVIVAWANGHVLFHDPARAPLRTASEAEFAAAWSAADFWALSILPGRERARADARAGARQREGASGAGLFLRTEEDTALVRLRDVAGSAFREGRYADASMHARALVERAPDDAYAWQLLASSLYLVGDDAAALDAWNRMGRPRNDLTRIDGLRRTRHAVIARAVGIAPDVIITGARLSQARRRVRMLPSVSAARVDYRPVEGGRAEVHAAVVERALLPHALPDLLVHGARAALEQRVRIDVSSPLGAGELWSGDVVWEEARRALELGVTLPHAFGVTGVWQVRAGERTLTHAPAAARVVRATRRTALLALSDWASARIRWQVGVSYDDWLGRGAYGGLRAGVELHSRAERAAVRTDVAGWLADGQHAFARTRVGAAVRSAPEHRGLEWQLSGGVQHVPPHAPRDLWSGAGAGLLAQSQLRAHSLYDARGRINSRWFAPRLAHATAEVRYWAVAAGPLRVGAAVFVDAAAAAGDPMQARAARAVDVGFGLRADVPGLAGGARLDVARGLVDGASALSLGWVEPWPAW